MRTIRTLAARRRKPPSVIVREAVARYASRQEKLSSDERGRLLAVLDNMIARPARSDGKTVADTDLELRDVRLARRSRGRRHPID